MSKTTVVLSFDDGRIDTYEKAYPILKKYNLPATVHITTGFIDGAMESVEWKSCTTPMTVENLIEMYRSGIEISSHGDKHQTEEKDFIGSVEKLKKWGVETQGIGFSVPNSAITEEEKKSFGEFLKGVGASYMRVGRHKSCYTLFSKICYVINKFTGLQIFYNLFNRHNLNKAPDMYSLYTVVVKAEDRIENIVKFIDKYNEDCNIILMLHSVLEKTDPGYGKDSWYMDITKFEKMCKLLKEREDRGKISVKSVIDIVRGENKNV